jgi:hypothetical protein
MSIPPSVDQSSARFIWVDDTAPYRNQFVRFDRVFDLNELPMEFPLHLFADTRYRLRLNGGFVAAGPGRFVTQHPEFDIHELAHLLKPGSNLISVEVNFFGASSYQSMPDGKPGFIAWGGGEGTDLATPGDWKAFRLLAWRPDSPLFSFAQNPVEICDTRATEAGHPAKIVVLEGCSALPWGELKPYSGAPVPFSVYRPQNIELAGRLQNAERILGFMSHDPQFYRHESSNTAKPWTAFATWILSPKSQTVTLSCFWSKLHCNGVPLTVNADTPFGNHAHCIAELREGWNLLVGEIEILTEYWAYCLGIPFETGLSLHGQRDASCVEPFSIAPNSPCPGICLPSVGDSEAPAGWFLHDGNSARLTPARIMAWDSPASDAVRNIKIGRLPEVSTIHATEATWCFSFAAEYLGYLVVDVDAPAGTTLDVATDDWQAHHGGVALYQSNPFTDSADRFILRGGRQRVELFHPRGGKLVQVTLRAPGAATACLSLHDLFVRSRQTLEEDESLFSCDKAALEWAWPVAMRTLIASTDESYSDCPWRERGSYIGDSYVNLHLNVVLNQEYRILRRTLRVFAEAQLPNGQLAGCAPSWLRKQHDDFTLIWILALHDFWSLTGDTTLVKELWPVVRRIWTSPTWERHSSGLWNAENRRLFIDWGCIRSERSGKANATINMFRFAAANACANLASALGEVDEATAFRTEGKFVEKSLLSSLWDESEGRFQASVDANTPALHANILALAFGIGDRKTRSRILSYVEPKLRENFKKGVRGEMQSGHLELYFLHYALPALATHERPDLAELLVDQHYGYLMNLGDDTFPECFCTVEKALGSRCHSWSGAAAIYAARHVLGIRPAEHGNPRKLLCDPNVHGITRASGRIAHPEGWIEIAWEKLNGKLHVSINAPQSVEIVFAEGLLRRQSDDGEQTTEACPGLLAEARG